MLVAYTNWLRVCILIDFHHIVFLAQQRLAAGGLGVTVLPATQMHPPFRAERPTPRTSATIAHTGRIPIADEQAPTYR
jgi:hypothetical protein